MRHTHLMIVCVQTPDQCNPPMMKNTRPVLLAILIPKKKMLRVEIKESFRLINKSFISWCGHVHRENERGEIESECDNTGTCM